MTATGRWREILIAGTTALAVACAQQRADNAPGAASDPAAPPDADSLMPPLPGYTTEDDAEPGEVESSLDHGSIRYEQVRRRIVLDEQGFTSGAVTAVTFHPDSGSAGQILDHIYGDAPRSSVQVAGEEMIRIDAEPFAVIAWVGPGFVVTFQRGQERSDEWLQDLVGSTVRAVADGGG